MKIAFFVVILILSAAAHAENSYDCWVLALKNQTVARFTVYPRRQQAQKYVLNKSGDFVLCSGIIEFPNMPANLYCYHGDQNTQIQFDPSTAPGLITAHQRRLTDGAEIPLAMAATQDGAPTLQLIFPTKDQNYGVMCVLRPNAVK